MEQPLTRMPWQSPLNLHSWLVLLQGAIEELLDLCTHVADGSKLVALDDAARCQLHQHAFDMEIDVSTFLMNFLLVWGPGDGWCPLVGQKLLFEDQTSAAQPELWGS